MSWNGMQFDKMADCLFGWQLITTEQSQMILKKVTNYSFSQILFSSMTILYKIRKGDFMQPFYVDNDIVSVKFWIWSLFSIFILNITPLFLIR